MSSMEIRLKNLQRHVDGPGDHLVAQVQQMGDGRTRSDTTDIIIEMSPEGGDIRIVDGEDVISVKLGSDFSIEAVLVNDVFMPEPE